MTNILKTFISIFIILNFCLNLQAETTKESFTKPAYDTRLDIDPEAREYYKYADEDSEASFNIGVIYRKTIKDYKLAEFWYKKSWNMENNKDTANNLGYLYDKLKQYNNAIKWYIKAMNKESFEAIQNLSLLYHKKLKDDIKAVEYFLPLINHRYKKEKVMKFFKIKYKATDETIQKGYEAQLNSKIIPEKLKYKGGI